MLGFLTLIQIAHGHTVILYTLNFQEFWQYFAILILRESVYENIFIIKIPDACIMPICTLHIVVIISIPCGSQSVHDRAWIMQRSYKIPMSPKLWCI